MTGLFSIITTVSLKAAYKMLVMQQYYSTIQIFFKRTLPKQSKEILIIVRIRLPYTAIE